MLTLVGRHTPKAISLPHQGIGQSTFYVENNMTKQIPLTRGKFALVDDADFDWLMQWKWHFHNNGYAVRNQHICMVDGQQKKKPILMHRLIAGTPPGMSTDHRDGDKLNNQRFNLRVATKSQNGMNRGSQNGSSSKFKGVFWFARTKKWRSAIVKKGKSKHLGYFSCENEAAKAYNHAAMEMHGEFVKLNIIEQDGTHAK